MEGAKQQIRAAFDIFDKEKTGCIIQEEVSSVMRYLNVYPSERDIVKRILPEVFIFDCCIQDFEIFRCKVKSRVRL